MSLCLRCQLKSCYSEGHAAGPSRSFLGGPSVGLQQPAAVAQTVPNRIRSSEPAPAMQCLPRTLGLLEGTCSAFAQLQLGPKWLDSRAEATVTAYACVCLACRSSHMQVAFLNEAALFYSDRDGHWFPTLRILHQYPDMMPKLRTDKGAIKFVLSGANIMCPGLTSPGATIHDEVGLQS